MLCALLMGSGACAASRWMCIQKQHPYWPSTVKAGLMQGAEHRRQSDQEHGRLPDCHSLGASCT